MYELGTKVILMAFSCIYLCSVPIFYPYQHSAAPSTKSYSMFPNVNLKGGTFRQLCTSNGLHDESQNTCSDMVHVILLLTVFIIAYNVTYAS